MEACPLGSRSPEAHAGWESTQPTQWMDGFLVCAPSLHSGPHAAGSPGCPSGSQLQGATLVRLLLQEAGSLSGTMGHPLFSSRKEACVGTDEVCTAGPDILSRAVLSRQSRSALRLPRTHLWTVLGQEGTFLRALFQLAEAWSWCSDP